ncbi:MAG: hypothetical protein IJU76_04715 [Desulfovibrionaceae bacterium]|nr:hypothetical protein [Desulfovibrionaceae bacterium]
MLRTITSFFLALFVLLIANTPSANMLDTLRANSSLAGYAQATYRQSVHKKHPLAATVRLALEATINKDSWIRGFVSGYGDIDFSVPGRDSDEALITPELSEGYITLDSRYLDCIIGMQHIRWGEADSLSTFDIINPIDYRNPISTARSSQRLAVGAIDLRGNLNGVGLLDLVLIPFPRMSRLPEYGATWEDKDLHTMRRTVASTPWIHATEEEGPYEPEVAARLKFFRPGYDFAFLFYRGYEHEPLYTASFSPQTMSARLHETYEIYQAYGASIAISVLEATLRGECTLKHDYPFQSDQIAIEKRNDFETIIGIDRNFLTNLNVNLQAFYFAHDGDEVSGKDRQRYGGTWSLSDKFLDDALKAGVRGEVFMNNGDSCVELFAEYEYDDNLRFFAGYMLFGGDEKNDLGQFDQNDHVYLGVKYSF